MAKRLFLIDGTAMAYRSYFAFATSARGGLTTRGGHPTSATYGFTISLRALLEKEKPDCIAVAFDGPVARLERTAIYPEYKSTREKAPDEMLAQLDDIRRVVEGYGIPIVESEVHEADDVIGTLAVQGRDAGMEVFIVTGDKDFMQLVDDKLKLWNLRGSTIKPEILGSKEVEAKFGVRPDQMIDFLALMGDSSDNIPGVPRVGQKTARGLLEQFGTLDAVLKRAEEVKQPSIKKALLENRELALLSRRLVTIFTEVPVGISVEELGPPAPDMDRLRDLFGELEFDSLRASLARKPRDQVPQDYHIVRTDSELDELIAKLKKSGGFAVDTETTSLNPRQADLVGVSFSWEEGVGYYVPFNLEEGLFGSKGSEASALLEKLRPLLEDAKLGKTGQNAKYDMAVFRRAGVEVRGVEFDTMLASYCLAPGVATHNLDALALRHFDYKKIPTKELLGTGKKQKTFDQVDIDLAGRYACEDADFTWRLRAVLEEGLEKAALTPLFRELEMPLMPVLLDMEWEGIAVDLPHLEKVSAKLGGRIEGLAKEIHELAGEPFNLNSPAQIGQVLFENMEVHQAAGISRPRRTRTGQYKTDAAVLEKLSAHHPVPRLLLEYRQLSKLKSTYVDSLPEMINPETGRIHTSFNQAVAATGRLSSDNPNLQNIPIRTTEGREVRRAFVSREEGWVLLSGDYSQIELRILAHLSGDQALVEAFRRGEDIHARTAALVHGLAPADVTPELRSQAKVINFGLMYGMGASRLASETGMTPPEARQFIEAYFQVLPRVKAYLDGILAEAQEKREVWTMFGRRRPLPDIDSMNTMQRIASENMAVNTPIQGAAADIIKRAMIDVHHRLRHSGLRTRMLLQVHDELVLDVPEEELEKAQELLVEAMENAASLDVPLDVSLGHGRSWLEAH